MIKGIKSSITILCCFCFVINVIYSQNTNNQQSLSQIFNNIQKQYNVQFNYAEETVDNIFVVAPSKELSLKEVLSYLETKTHLSFTMMTSHIILVKPKTTLIICGYLKDGETLSPLALATIQTTKSIAVSDENGFFKIEVETTTQALAITYVGYKTIIKLLDSFNKENCETILMQPDLQILSEIIISNYLTSGISKLSNGSYQIDFLNFDILPGLIDHDVLQSVQALPGIQSVNETVSNINIRGGSHDQNLILWDGIKMYQSGHFFGLISMYNPNITQKVYLRKNGSGVELTDGVSGTIMMQTEQEVNHEFKGIIGVNFTDVNGFVDVALSDVSSLQVAGRKSISDFIETPTYTAFFNRISQDTEVANNIATIKNTDKVFDFYDTSLRWIYNISDKDELRINFINVYNQLQFNENATINNQIESRESNLMQYSIAGALNYKKEWSSKFRTVFEVYETDYKLKSINANIIDSQRFLQENKVSETSMKLRTNYIINKVFQLQSGYHFVETEVTNLDDVDNPLFRFLISEVVRTHGVFTQLAYNSLHKQSAFNLGVRYNYIDKLKKTIIEPRLSFTQQLLNHFTFELLGEFKHQNTSQVINFQNDFLGIEKRRWQLSNNNDIPVITSKQASAGLSYSNSGWLLNAEWYYKAVEGITAQSQGFQNQYEFVKSKGKYQAKGVDVLLRKQIDNFNIWLSYSNMNNIYGFKDLEPNSFPSNFDITHSVTVGLAYSSKNIKLSAGLNWYSGKPVTQPVVGNEIVNNEVNFDATNATNLDDYMRLDVSAIYDFNLGEKNKAHLGISFWNVLDKENQINNFYRVNNGMLNETIQSSLGLTPNAVLKLFF